MHKKFLIALLAAVAMLSAVSTASAAVSAGNTGWLWGNPLPQGNDLKPIDMVGTRGYAGGSGGTLLRTDDAGASWSTVRTGLLDDIQLVRTIGADSVVFAGSCALRRSDDGGATVRRLAWTQSEDGCNPVIRSFHFPDGNNGYLMLSNGDVYSTADAGATWTKRTALPGSPIKGGQDKPGDIWFTGALNGVATAGQNIYRTTDGASSWTIVNNVSTAELTRFSFVNPNIGIVVGKGKNALMTADGGATWAPLSVNAGTAGIDLADVDCANPNDCIAVAADGSQLYRTGDAGVSWNAVSPSTAAIGGVGYSSAARVVAVGVGGATVVSNDGGATWQTISGGVDGHYRSLIVKSASTAYAFGDLGALARTTDGGMTWVPVGVSTSSNLLGVDFPSAQRGYAVDAKGVLMRTINGGASWQFLDTGGVKASTLRAINDATLLLIGPKGIYRSVNGGDSFTRAIGKGLAKAKMNRCDQAGSVLACYQSRGKSKSAWLGSADGKKWKSFKLPGKATTVQLDMVSARVGFVLDTKRELWLTKNSGKKWNRVETTGTTIIDSIAFGDAKNGYLTDSSGRILHTVDGGKTWSRQYPFYEGDSGLPVMIETASAKTAFMGVSGTSRLFSTTTGGAIGAASTLTIKSSARKVKRKSTIKITGKLSPAVGGEQVSVVARPVGAKNGTRWTVQEVSVDANGRFTTRWKIKKPTIFIARWSGDSGHDGDGSTAVIVKIK